MKIAQLATEASGRGYHNIMQIAFPWAAFEMADHERNHQQKGCFCVQFKELS